MSLTLQFALNCFKTYCLDISDLPQPSKTVGCFKTRDTGILDWFLTNKANLFHLKQLPKIGASDHYTIIVNPLTSSPSTVGTKNVRVRDIRNSAWRSFGRWITEKDWISVHSAPTCRTKYKIFMKNLQEAIDIMLPWKTVRVHISDRPWITKKLKTLIRERQLAFHRHGRDSNCYKLLREKVYREKKVGQSELLRT